MATSVENGEDRENPLRGLYLEEGRVMAHSHTVSHPHTHHTLTESLLVERIELRPRRSQSSAFADGVRSRGSLLQSGEEHTCTAPRPLEP